MGVPALRSRLEENTGSNTGVLLTERQSVLSEEIFSFLMYQEVLGFDFLASATALFTHSWGGTLSILFSGNEEFFIR